MQAVFKSPENIDIDDFLCAEDEIPTNKFVQSVGKYIVSVT